VTLQKALNLGSPVFAGLQQLSLLARNDTASQLDRNSGKAKEASTRSKWAEVPQEGEGEEEEEEGLLSLANGPGFDRTEGVIPREGYEQSGEGAERAASMVWYKDKEVRDH
jgi:hypothetical protein